jgi:transposase-like protein
MNKAVYSTYEIRVRAVKAVRRGMTIKTVARAYHVHPATIQRWLARYRNENGCRGLRRRPASGRPRLLTGLHRQDWQAIAKGGRKVRRVAVENRGTSPLFTPPRAECQIPSSLSSFL